MLIGLLSRAALNGVSVASASLRLKLLRSVCSHRAWGTLSSSRAIVDTLCPRGRDLCHPVNTNLHVGMCYHPRLKLMRVMPKLFVAAGVRVGRVSRLVDPAASTYRQFKHCWVQVEDIKRMYRLLVRIGLLVCPLHFSRDLKSITLSMVHA